MIIEPDPHPAEGHVASRARGVASDMAAIARIDAVPQILEAVAHVTGLRFAAVARVTDTTWTACATYDKLGFGLQPGGELVLGTTLCDDIRQTGMPIVFANASEHPVYSKHHTPQIYGLQSYVSVPIYRKGGKLFGTLCAIDSLPATFDEAHVVRTLQLFAELIGNYLESDERWEEASSQLKDELEVAELRDQFIAVLGHDLRNPLQAIRMGTDLLEKEVRSERGRRHLARIDSSVQRIIDLVEDILDFARGRLGGGIPVAMYADEALADELRRIVQEVRTASGRDDIDDDIRIDVPVVCDSKRVAQLLSNLLSNAVAHGTPSSRILVSAATENNGLVLEVRNQGVIPDDKKEKLFRPFSRSTGDLPSPGLGLGLYIASEIAKAHGGQLIMESEPVNGTCFRLRIPV